MSDQHFTTVREALQQASLLFTERRIQNPRLNAEVLLQHLLGWTKAKLLAEDREPFPSEKSGLFQMWMDRRLQGEPLQYIVGVQEFYGRDFHVNPAVLIPRPETEILIEEVLKRRQWWNRPLIADIGTGSGAIAVTLALEWPESGVYAVDISLDAIGVAQENAKRLGAQVHFLHGDLVGPLLSEGLRLDVLVSNPPYIPSEEVDKLAVEVRGHEPRLALDGGHDGLEPYRRITQALPNLMRETGPALVGFEVGIGQAQAVAALIGTNWPGSETGIVRDLQGIERVVLGWI
ncbi:peptide chain release factor N(5)-glutamine methyltransferase [Effusibacillus lacus]|uniref:Release factor glutamine methyltransferase n=1 Tax=Effusibacillus lacus TaxID=1348429 RepID=A0A292YHA3_9BACL|nr:peptide chain release factor N(5)-glutamine methyltransferase [Effusibacillus lacus]TCS68261.1 release factor glutamine methyltransferase [Effusibacillus lacus]GAX90187.1 protein-(glutamine-N5) methyltransferase, release factor-specific [Effusibacillus lacus]